MAGPRLKTLKEADSLELLRALGAKVVRSAKDLPGQVAAKAHGLVDAGGRKMDEAVCAAVRKHLGDCGRCRAFAKRAADQAGRRRPKR